MPTPTIPAGNLFMNATLYTGTGVGSRVITNGVAGASFQPDFVWLKNRTSPYSHQTNDSVRGATNGCLYTDLTYAVDANFGITSFNSNGFTLGNTASLISQSFGSQNGTGDNYVGWQWKAGGTAVTNTSGTISSQVSANTTSGFSVVTYTGSGTGGATVGHGLGVAPSFIAIKSRSSTESWQNYHVSLGATKAIFLNLSQGFTTSNVYFNDTSPTSSVFSLGTGTQANGNGTTYVAYCWSQIAGYSAFGSYTGNGSADGPFIYTGFRPRFVLLKRTDTSEDWVVYDTARDPYNTSQYILYPNGSYAESSGYALDILSNGFKLRNTVTSNNASGGTYIYAVFAENPFKYANAR